MRLVDTSARIEWLMKSQTEKTLRAEVPARNAQLVPTIVQLELAFWARRELTRAEAKSVEAYSAKCIVVPPNSRIAFRAADIRNQFRLATADAIIYATALEHDADLLTCDAHFRDLPGVIFIPKAGE